MNKAAPILKLQETIAAKKADRDQDSHVSHAELLANVDHVVMRAQENSRALAMRVSTGSLDDGVLYTSPKPDGRIDLLPPLVALFGADAVRSLLSRFVSLVPDGPTKAERDARRDAIDAEILDLEKAEERSIRALEREGVEFVRRPDASPAVVLSP